MAFISDHRIYDALPISNDVLDEGGVELLRAAIVDEKIFVTARLNAFVGHYAWGLVLADVARRLASLLAADGQKTEAEMTADIADEFARSFRRLGADGARYPSPRKRKGTEGAKVSPENKRIDSRDVGGNLSLPPSGGGERKKRTASSPKPAKSARSRAKPQAPSRAKSKPSTKTIARREGARPKR
jgi:Domain of unknown function (DUF5076)